MAMNEPYYNRSETDLKIENVEYRLDAKLSDLDRKFDRMLSAFEILGAHMETGFQRIDTEMQAGFKRVDQDFKRVDSELGWFKLLIGVVVLPLVIAVISLALPHLR